MSTEPGGPDALPERPNLRHLKDQAKDLVKTRKVSTLAEAQLQIARLYGFSSWPKLKAHVEYSEEVRELRRAIGRNDLGRVKELMTANPQLHRAPLGYGNDGPLTMVAEWQFDRGWRDPGGFENRKRLAMAEWMIEHGSDVHQGGGGPLMRAALFGDRIPMMELLVKRGADVNALWHGEFPVIFAACETLQAASLRWLLEHGANPNCDTPRSRHSGTALDCVIGSYGRSAQQLRECIEVLVKAGARTRYDFPAVIDILCGSMEQLRARIAENRTLLDQRFPELDFGTTGGRMLTLRGATLLHVAAEYQNLEAAKLLLDYGAGVNARAVIDEAGVGGQTPLFHAVTQNGDAGLEIARFLVDHGADVASPARVPGHYERESEILECTPLGYASRFENEPGKGEKTKTVAWLRGIGAPEIVVEIRP